MCNRFKTKSLRSKKGKFVLLSNIYNTFTTSLRWYLHFHFSFRQHSLIFSHPRSSLLPALLFQAKKSPPSFSDSLLCNSLHLLLTLYCLIFSALCLASHFFLAGLKFFCTTTGKSSIYTYIRTLERFFLSRIHSHLFPLFTERANMKARSVSVPEECRVQFNKESYQPLPRERTNLIYLAVAKWEICCTLRTRLILHIYLAGSIVLSFSCSKNKFKL